MEQQKIHIPIVERLKGIPGIFGIRLGEQPAYEVLKQDQNREIRQYHEQLMITTTVNSNYEASREEAFLRLAAYIFGHNHDRQKISMTAPVLQKEGEHIPMTTPVVGEKKFEGWSMSFILPKHLNLDTAPDPDDKHLHLSMVPTQKWAVLRYTGATGENQMVEKVAELKSWLATQDEFVAVSDARWAQYDGPIVIPFLRRNEVQIQVERNQ